MDTLFVVLPLLVAFGFGAVLGSYLFCALWRIPRRLALGGRSVCDNCGTPLRWYDNIPIISWLLLRGHSHCCQTSVPWRYPVAEAGCGLLLVVITTLFGLVVACVVAGSVIAATVIWAIAAGVSLGEEPPVSS